MATREYHRAYNKQWRERHKAAGNCSRCGMRREPDRGSVCRECVRIMGIKKAHGIENDCASASTGAA